MADTDEIWLPADCAKFLRESVDVFLRKTRFEGWMPKPLAISRPKRPKWSKIEVMRAALSRSK